jgi:pilus assembly protein CpaE
MDPGKLKVSIIFGTGNVFPGLPELLNNLPQVDVSEQSVDPTEFLNRSTGTPPDTMVVYLDGMTSPPEWIEDLTRKYPQAPVLVCSERKELDFVLKAMQLGAREFLPLPLSPTEVQAALKRVRSARKSLPGPAQSMVVAVIGHKGGLGTTTIAINLAVALAELQTERCALVDLGRPFPDIGNFLDQVPTFDLNDVLSNLNNLDQSFFQKVMQPYGDKLAILHGISDFREQDNLEMEGVDKIFKVLRGLYKHIVVDLGHLFDDLFLRVFKEADLVLMLTELNVPNFRNLRKLWPVLKEWGPLRQKVKVVINRHNKSNDNDLGLRELPKILGEPPLAILPGDYDTLIEAINQGVPLSKADPRSKLYQGLRELAQKIDQSTSGEGQAALGSQPRRRFWIF